MIRIIVSALCMLSLMLALPMIPHRAEAAALNPRCVAENCPTCPQPLGSSRLDQSCRQCLKSKLKRIMSCSKSQGSSALSPAIIGLWQSDSGLSMLVVQTTRGFRGHLHSAPMSMGNTYPVNNMVIMNATQSGSDSYNGHILIPQGNWSPARFVVKDGGMISYHPGGLVIKWTKRGR